MTLGTLTLPRRWLASGMPLPTRCNCGNLDAHETTSGAAAKLRTAFLSDSCPGRWQPGGKSTPAVWRYFGLRTFCQVIRRLRRCMTSGLQWRPTLKFISCPRWRTSTLWMGTSCTLRTKMIPTEGASSSLKIEDWYTPYVSYPYAEAFSCCALLRNFG